MVIVNHCKNSIIGRYDKAPLVGMFEAMFVYVLFKLMIMKSDSNII